MTATGPRHACDREAGAASGPRCRPCIGAQASPTGAEGAQERGAARDLARLILGLMAVLREVMERQAIRHLDAGALSPEEEERVGRTLALCRTRIGEVAAAFGIAEHELRLRIGDVLPTQRDNL
ncbi:MAG: gas vesicle protein K [Pseudomonadota bacterium]